MLCLATWAVLATIAAVVCFFGWRCEYKDHVLTKTDWFSLDSNLWNQRARLARIKQSLQQLMAKELGDPPC